MNDSTTNYKEQFNTFCTEIDQTSSEKNDVVPEYSELTSTLAESAGLARASEHLTLLVDGDLRSPDVHNVFDVPLRR